MESSANFKEIGNFGDVNGRMEQVELIENVPAEGVINEQGHQRMIRNSYKNYLYFTKRED